MKLYSALMLMHFQRKLHLNAPYLSLIKIHRAPKTFVLHNEGANGEIAFDIMTTQLVALTSPCLHPLVLKLNNFQLAYKLEVANSVQIPCLLLTLDAYFILKKTYFVSFIVKFIIVFFFQGEEYYDTPRSLRNSIFDHSKTYVSYRLCILYWLSLAIVMQTLQEGYNWNIILFY